MGNGRGRGRGGRGGYITRGNRGGYRGGGYQGGGSSEYSSMGNEYQGSSSYYGYVDQSSHTPTVVRDNGFIGDSGNGFHGFRGSQGASYTLVDEAWNTGRHMGDLGSTLGLRHSAVKFVPSSTGNLNLEDLFKPLNLGVQPEKQEGNASEGGVEKIISPDLEPSDTQASMDKPQEDLSQIVGLSRLDLNNNNNNNNTGIHVRSEQDFATGTAPGTHGFVIDLVGDPSLLSKPEVPGRVTSPTLSTCSSEEIVFVPRRNRGDAAAKASARATSRPTRGRQPKEQETHTKTSETAAQLASADEPNIRADSTVGIRPEVRASIAVVGSAHKSTMCPAEVLSETKGPTEESCVVENKWARRSTSGNRKRKGAGRRKRGDDDEALKDYQENILAQIQTGTAGEAGEGSDAMRTRNLTCENNSPNTTDLDEAEDEAVIDGYKRELWEPEYLQDLDLLDTASEGPHGIVRAVLRRRQRPSGLQYMVTWQDDETETPRWVLAEKLDSSSDHKIEEFLLEEQKLAEGSLSSDDSSDQEDDEDLKLARLLQRREELGIAGGSDLDSLDAEIMDLDADFVPLGAGKTEKKKKTKRRGGGNDIDPEDFMPDPGTGHFPSASWMADACEGFDVTEWDRPSLAKRKGKGKHHALNLSDSEQEELQASWAKDREKKKIRKQERKALRAEGMLGRKAQKTGKRDPNAKFLEGITMEQLKREIQTFLENDIQCLTLPPMDKKNRKIVHHIAMAFNLKSKSFGSGKTRFPTLIKTSSSAIYEEDSTRIAQIMRTERFLARPDVGGGQRGGGKRGGGRGGGAGRARGEWGGAKGVRHKEGDIIGAGAAELAQDNRGRIMLEKMGYKAGMALGATNNKGIIVPVAAVMKVGKAGLG